MTFSKNRTERRVRETRQLLQQAFIELVQEKGFTAITIQELTERADVNRGTFYIHFADKYMLIDQLIREQFHLLLTASLPSNPCWNRANLRLLIQAVLDCFEGKYRHQRYPTPILDGITTLLERAIHEELTAVLLKWLKEKPDNAGVNSDPVRLQTLQTTARVICWSIFGTALQWSQEPLTISADRMTDAILQIVLAGVPE
ncbi:MAG TPA: TetR/AcrR family transcriptional regulator [Phototrophicaceae bacterium]|nr:TetR/AcrR family transcriptional regulator [Phototrophicaceae bacterium]